VSQIVWLVSYPKSGNTWLRAFLANLLADNDTPADINNLNVGGIASNRRIADEALGLECSDLTPEEIERYRPEVYRSRANGSETLLFVKTHDAYTLNSDSEPLFPSDITRAAVYVVRSPLDVSVSFAQYATKTIDEAIEGMARETMALAARHDRLDLQLRQRLLSWSHHVSSWLDQIAIPVHVMRYEDISREPIEAFTGAVRFLGLEHDLERVRRAVTFSSFDTLRQQELKHGFREKPLHAESFFRSGRVGAWREILTKTQVERLIRDHGTIMRRLGYVPETTCAE